VDGAKYVSDFRSMSCGHWLFSKLSLRKLTILETLSFEGHKHQHKETPKDSKENDLLAERGRRLGSQ
jgi:hypothetical protein